MAIPQKNNEWAMAACMTQEEQDEFTADLVERIRWWKENGFGKGQTAIEEGWNAALVKKIEAALWAWCEYGTCVNVIY